MQYKNVWRPILLCVCAIILSGCSALSTMVDAVVPSNSGMEVSAQLGEKNLKQGVGLSHDASHKTDLDLDQSVSTDTVGELSYTNHSTTKTNAMEASQITANEIRINTNMVMWEVIAYVSLGWLLGTLSTAIGAWIRRKG